MPDRFIIQITCEQQGYKILPQRSARASGGTYTDSLVRRSLIVR
jgi:hypothetical protein